METSVAQSGSVILGTRSGGNVLLSANSEISEPKKEASGGQIYTTADMPALEELLEQLEIVTAVIEKPIPTLRQEQGQRHSATSKTGLSFSRALILGGFPAATFAVGAVMAVGALAGAGAVSNPYLALYLILAGIGLGITSWVAMHVAHRR